MHRLAEEDDISHVADGTAERAALEILSDVADGMLVQLRDVAGIVVDAASVAKVNQPGHLVLKTDVPPVDFLVEPQVTLIEESSRYVFDGRMGGYAFIWCVLEVIDVPQRLSERPSLRSEITGPRLETAIRNHTVLPSTVPTFAHTGSGKWHVVGPDGCWYGREFDDNASPDETVTATDFVAYEPAPTLGDVRSDTSIDEIAPGEVTPTTSVSSSRAPSKRVFRTSVPHVGRDWNPTRNAGQKPSPNSNG